jgi:N-acetylglucosamine kinase-like BadF-type ATPase
MPAQGSTPIRVLVAESGGTFTRGVLLEAVGPSVRVLASSVSSGSNANTVGRAAAQVAWMDVLSALRLEGELPVTAGALSCAGSSDVGVAAYREMFGAVPVVVHDVLAPVWAVSPSGSGTVLVAGTGAMAVAFERGVGVRQAGGWGWWLGDEGSGTWLGRELVRLALGDVDAGRVSALTASMARVLGVGALTRETVFGSVYADVGRVAAASGRFAPLVDVLLGDPQVDALVERAAGHLAALVRAVAAPGSSGPAQPVTFAGSVAAGRVGARAAALLGGVVVRQPHGLAGGAMLALDAAGVSWSLLLRDEVVAAVAGVH